MRLLLLTVLLSACKLTSLPSADLRRSARASDHAVFLNISPQGMVLEVPGALGPGNLPLPQAFYRLRTAKQEFSIAAVNAQTLRAAPVVFSEIVLAWQSHKDTWLCFLEDVTGSRLINPTKDVGCYRQDTRHDYLRQFVEWCVKDNRYGLPFSIKQYCNVGKTSASNTVLIPLSCFAGNGNMCFPPEKRTFRLGRNARHKPDRRLKKDKYYIADYLNTSDTNFTALLDDLYAQATDCRKGADMKVRTDKEGHSFHCYCPQHRNEKFFLNGQPRTCDSMGYYYFFSSFKK